jgi:cell division protein FtsZ
MLVNIIGGTDLSLPKVNELMSAITGQFGRDSHIIMGAVIDEAMAGRVEVCVLGTSDMGGRMIPQRRPAAKPGTKAPFAPRPESPTAHAPANLVQPTREADLPWAPGVQNSAPGAKVSQDEFGFGEVESRGYFEKSERNLFDGQDLDVPTYLRKGIRIHL